MRREPQDSPEKPSGFPWEAPIVFQWADSGSEKREKGALATLARQERSFCPERARHAGAEISFNIFLPLLPDFEPKTRVEAVGPRSTR